MWIQFVHNIWHEISAQVMFHSYKVSTYTKNLSGKYMCMFCLMYKETQALKGKQKKNLCFLDVCSGRAIILYTEWFVEILSQHNLEQLSISDTEIKLLFPDPGVAKC